MLTNLFKPAWKSNSVEKRLNAIADFDSNNAEHQKHLSQIANGDIDVSVCIAAIQKLSSAKEINQLSLKHADETVRTAASKRLDVLMGESGGLSSEEFDDVLNQSSDLKIRVAAHAKTESVRNKAIEGLSENQLLEVLSATSYTDLRQQIATKLVDSDSLESARKVLRGKDKNAERIVKSKLEASKNLQRQQAENEKTVMALIEEVEYLSGREDWLPEFTPRCEAHGKRWDALDFEIKPELKQRYQTARTILDAQYQERITIENTQKSQTEVVVKLKKLINTIADRDLKESMGQQLEVVDKQKQIESDWSSLSHVVKANDDLINEYQKHISVLKSANQLITEVAPLFTQTEAEFTQKDSEKHQPIRELRAALNKLNWPEDNGVLQLETELQEQLSDWTSAKKEAAESHERQLTLVHKNISSIFHFAKIGNLGRAKQMCVRVEKALPKFTGKDAKALQTRYEEAFETLGDMGDWKSFATEPKYVELCVAMEQLIGSKTHPDKLFKEMKALQQQWKGLGNTDISDQYWPRFKEAADKVYEPCDVFFKERKAQRKRNLEKRQSLLIEMQQCADQTNPENKPDFKTIESKVRSISSRFTAIKDVEHKAGQKQWEQFSKTRSDVYAMLDVEYDANIELKQTLIKQAAALAEEDAKDENLSTLKTLQHRWKQVGVTRRKDDQKAWTEFKKQGDLVFGKIQGIRQEQRNETDQQINAYRDIIKDIQKLAKTATELSQADQQFSVLQARYDELPVLPEQLPEKLIAGIQRDYTNACSQFDECHDRIIKNMQKGQLDALRQKANLCIELEALYVNADQQGSVDDKKLETINTAWDKINLEDSEFTKRIEKRRAQAESITDRKQITADRKMMCIQLEIAKGAETPEEDKAERMKFQLDQMNQSGLGLQSLNSPEALQKMQLDWLCKPGAEPKQQAILDKRFYLAFDT